MQSSELFIITHKKIKICIILKLTVQIAIPESHGGKQVLKIQEFSSDVLWRQETYYFPRPFSITKVKLLTNTLSYWCRISSFL